MSDEQCTICAICCREIRADVKLRGKKECFWCWGPEVIKTFYLPVPTFLFDKYRAELLGLEIE